MDTNHAAAKATKKKRWGLRILKDQSLYQFLTNTVDGVTSALELKDKQELDTRVEAMLNSGYAKSDFIIVTVVDYSVTADNYSDDE